MKASRHRAAEEEEAEEPPQNSKKRSKNPGENPKKLKNQNRENPKMPKQEKAVPTVKTSGASVEGPRLWIDRSADWGSAMCSNAMRDARFCWAGRFCKRLWPFLVAKAVSSTKIAPTQHNDGVNCDQLVRLLEPIAQPTPVFRPFFARSPKVLTKRFTWHPKTSRCSWIQRRPLFVCRHEAGWVSRMSMGSTTRATFPRTPTSPYLAGMV